MITVEHLTKCYGDFQAVKDLSFQIEDGHVYGFLGPNGAGKSTTMNMMTGCLSATSGQVKIDGLDIFSDAKEARKLIGYLPEQPPLYLSETPREYLRFVGRAKGLKEPELSRQIGEVIQKTRLKDVENRLISALSKGYRQRVGIAQALLGSPRVIILDEPTVGLDPIQIIEIRDLIRELGREHTVILSSHILSEVQTLCEKILIISKGELMAFDTPANLEEQLRTSAELLFTADAPLEPTKALAEGLSFVTHASFEAQSDGTTAVQLQTDLEDLQEASRRLFFAFAEEGIALLEIRIRKANLEDIFLELTESGQDCPLPPEAPAPAADTEPEKEDAPQ